MDESTKLKEMIRGCKKGSNESFNQLIDAYSKRLFGYFYRLTGKRDVSHDLLSELFLKLVEKIQSYKGGSFEKWLFTVAGNIFHDYLRDKYRKQKLLDHQIENAPLPKAPLASSNETITVLQCQLEKLDADTAELIMARYYGDLSFKELAEMRKEPIGTTLSKVHRGLKKLRELMENENE